MRGIIDKKSGVATAMPIIVRKISVQEIISTYGEPRTIFNSPSGVKTHLYDSFLWAHPMARFVKARIVDGRILDFDKNELEVS